MVSASLVTTIGVGVPIGLLLKRRMLDYKTLIILIALVGGVGVNLVLINQLMIWCDILNIGSSITGVSCTGFRFVIYNPILMGLIGAFVTIIVIMRRPS